MLVFFLGPDEPLFKSLTENFLKQLSHTDNVFGNCKHRLWPVDGNTVYIMYT